MRFWPGFRAAAAVGRRRVLSAPPYVNWIVVSLAVWSVATLAQTRASASTWALLDVVAHAAIAAACGLWLYPGWGSRPVVAAVLAGTLLDADHFLAAGSLSLQQVATLSGRPPTHGLPAATLIALALGLVFGARIGIAAGIGLFIHILGDATVTPGVPLLVPLVAREDVMIPPAVFVLAVVATSALAFVLGSGVRRTSPEPVAPPATP